MVKEVFVILLTQITHMFNRALQTSIFPEAWKEALIIPIPKSGNLSKVQNYKPISLLPLPGKILEKLVHKQLSDYLDKITFLTEKPTRFPEKSFYNSLDSPTDKLCKQKNR